MTKTALVLAALVSCTTAAAYEGPYVIKTNSSGFVPREYVRNETCELYTDKVVITKQFGLDHAIIETRRINVIGGLKTLTKKASQENSSEKQHGICDLPATTVSAIVIHDNGLDEKIALFNTGGCGTPTLTREGPATKILMDMMDLFCPKTHTANHP